MATIDSHEPGSPAWFELSTNNQDAAKAFYSSLISVLTDPQGAFFALHQSSSLNQ